MEHADTGEFIHVAAAGRHLLLVFSRTATTAEIEEVSQSFTSVDKANDRRKNEL